MHFPKLGNLPNDRGLSPMLIKPKDLRIRRGNRTRHTETEVNINNTFDHSKTESEKYSEEKQIAK